MGKSFTYVPLSPVGIIWFQPKNDDVLGLLSLWPRAYISKMSTAGSMAPFTYVRAEENVKFVKKKKEK